MSERPEIDRLGHLLWEVSARNSLITEAALAVTTLTPAGVGVLDQIVTHPGTTIADITRRAPKSQQAISQVVSRLEKLGYVERRLAGGRSVGLHATEAGTRAHAEGIAIEDAVESRMQEALGAERYQRLRELLAEARPVMVDMQAAHRGAK